MITMDETWLYQYDKKTNQQSISGKSGSPHLQKLRVQKFAWKLSPRFFVNKKASYSLIMFQRFKLSKRNITHLCWCNWRTFWRKNAAKVSKGVLFLHENAPANQAIATQKKLVYLIFQCLQHPRSSLDLALSDKHLFPCTEKAIKTAIFVRRGRRCCRGDLVGRTTIWRF